MLNISQYSPTPKQYLHGNVKRVLVFIDRGSVRAYLPRAYAHVEMGHHVVRAAYTKTDAMAASERVGQLVAQFVGWLVCWLVGRSVERLVGFMRVYMQGT